MCLQKVFAALDEDPVFLLDGLHTGDANYRTWRREVNTTVAAAKASRSKAVGPLTTLLEDLAVKTLDLGFSVELVMRETDNGVDSDDEDDGEDDGTTTMRAAVEVAKVAEV